MNTYYTLEHPIKQLKQCYTHQCVMHTHHMLCILEQDILRNAMNCQVLFYLQPTTELRIERYTNCPGKGNLSQTTENTRLSHANRSSEVVMSSVVLLNTTADGPNLNVSIYLSMQNTDILLAEVD